MSSIAKKAEKIIQNALNQVGLYNGDNLLVHSDSTAVREMSGLKWADSLNLLKECFLNIIGNNGTLYVPTFNWNFCNGKPYIQEKTRSQVGMFTNNVLFDERSRRSFHPIYSFAAIGPAAEETFSNISASSFGEGSVFDHLYQQNVKIVLFNSYADIAFIHYVEQKKGVEYRKLKYFTGETVVNGESKIGTFDFYVRDKNDQTQYNSKGLYDLLINSRKMHNIKINNHYPVSQIESREFCQILLDELSYNPSFLRIPKQ